MLKLTDLNTDCLLKIFQYCSERELVALCRANVFLCGIIESHIFYGLTQDLVMCGHRNSPSIEERNKTQLTYWERLKVSKNWVSGTYQERPYYHHAQMFPTKLYLERDNLYITHTRYLRRYRRSSTDGLQRRYEEEIRAPTNSDISDFVKKDDTLFAGRVCGTCFVWDPEEGITEQKMHQASEYLYCVDFVNELYATSTDKCCKVWHRSQEFGFTHFDLVVQLPQHSFKSLKLSSDGQWLYGGLYTDKERRALRAIHIESGEEVVFNSNTISIYDLKIKDDNILFTANFDTTFRLFDRRIDRDVAIYEDPFDSSFYCLEYDGLYGVLCGTNRHARVNLYDIRMPKYVQLYFPGRTRQHNSRSPVYSLACDSRYMFVATDHNLRVFDFKTNCGTQRDYANMYDQTQRYIKV